MSDQQNTAGEESFISHLIELRSRLVKAVLGVLVLFCIMFFVWPGPAAIYDFLARPMVDSLPEGSRMIATGIITPFLVPMKATAVAAFILALPWVLYQVWAFIAPGLYAHEKRLIVPLVVSSSALFMAGAVFCYVFVFGTVFKFISEFAPKQITISPDIESYLDFVIMMCLAFGVTFEVPVIVVVLVRMGWITVEKLKQIRAYYWVGATVVAAFISPPDLWSMVFMMVPLWVLYEVGIWVAPLFVRATQRPEEVAD